MLYAPLPLKMACVKKFCGVYKNALSYGERYKLPNSKPFKFKSQVKTCNIPTIHLNNFNVKMVVKNELEKFFKSVLLLIV